MSPAGALEAAMAISVDFASMPFDLETFYELLGFPEYLAIRAAGDPRAEAEIRSTSTRGRCTPGRRTP